MKSRCTSPAQVIQLAQRACEDYRNGNFTASRETFRRAVDLEPRNADLWNDLAAACYELALYDEAAEAAQEALRLNPHHIQAHISRGALSLRASTFQQGWEDYEWLCKLVPALGRLPENLRWTGEVIRDRSVLILDEQGFGDTIQFMRFVPLVAQQGARVYLKVKPDLRRLIEANPHLGSVLRDGDTLQFHAWSPLVALPRLLGAAPGNLGAPPYLHAPGGPIPEVLRDTTKLKVGLIWTGSPKNVRNPIRSMPLPELLPLLRLAKGGNYRFFHLHHASHAAQIEAAGAGDLIVELCDSINDFADLADIIASLDLVIGTDTAVPHLAGALGKPVWLLLSHVPDWRWTAQDGRSLWYPSMRTFRQPSHGDWASVVERAVEELALFASASRPLRHAEGPS